MSNFGAEPVDLTQVHFTPELLRLIPAEMVYKYRVLPVYKNGEIIGVATANPEDSTIDRLTAFLNTMIEVRLADKSQLDAFILLLYGSSPR